MQAIAGAAANWEAHPFPKITIAPIHVYYDDADLATTRRHGIGWKVTCNDCGDVARAGSYNMAQGAKREHARSHRVSG